MDLSEIDWDYNKAGAWPLGLKVIVTLLICAMVTGGGIYQFTMDQKAKLETLEQKEKDLKAEFEHKQTQAANLVAYQNQLKKIEASLADMLKKMPSKAEVAELLRRISQKAQESGLEISLFETQAPVSKQFYYELPTKMEVLGQYEELGLFVSSLATLPRIVTIHNVKINSPENEKTANKDKKGRLEMKAIIRTYNESAEEDENQEKDAADG